MEKAHLEEHVQGLGKFFRINAPFDEALAGLRTRGIRYPISARDLAYARMQQRRSNSLSSNGSYIREGFLYLKNSPVLLALNSPLLNQGLAKKAVQANKNGDYFFTENKQAYEKAMAQAEKDKDKEPEKRRVLILPSNNNFLISENENFEVLQGLLKDQAKDYLDFNKQNIPVYLINQGQINSGKGTLLTQLWFGGLDYRSVLGGLNRNLGYLRVRGVLNSAKGTQSRELAQEVKVYTPTQLKKALIKLKMSGLENQLLDALK